MSLRRWQLAGLNVGRRRRVGRCARARAQCIGPFPTFLANKASRPKRRTEAEVSREGARVVDGGLLPSTRAVTCRTGAGAP